jgi:hypothetical protein
VLFSDKFVIDDEGNRITTESDGDCCIGRRPQCMGIVPGGEQIGLNPFKYGP